MTVNVAEIINDRIKIKTCRGNTCFSATNSATMEAVLFIDYDNGRITDGYTLKKATHNNEQLLKEMGKRLDKCTTYLELIEVILDYPQIAKDLDYAKYKVKNPINERLSIEGKFLVSSEGKIYFISTDKDNSVLYNNLVSGEVEFFVPAEFEQSLAIKNYLELYDCKEEPNKITFEVISYLEALDYLIALGVKP